MSKTQPARGMRDFLPEDVRKRNYVVGIIKEVYESYGFEPLETPAVENLETLVGKYGEEGNQLIFKILKRGEKLDLNDKELADLALRYDLTVPLARVVAQHRNDLPRFFKRYQIQPVWRADRPARGRFREFYQCDVDQIGSTSMLVEAELCSAVSEILTRLGFDDFVVKFNNRKILEGMLELVNIPKEKYADVLVSIDKLDKIGIDGVYEELISRGIQDNQINLLESFFNPEWKSSLKSKIAKKVANPKFNSLALASLSNIFKDNIIGSEGIEEVKKIVSLTLNTVVSSHLLFDNTLARGLSYYTGAIFEINVPDLAGSLGGGGRYDGLIGMFGKEQIPACGFSLGLERILVVMEERGMFQKLIDEGKLNSNSADVLIACFDESLITDCLKLAEELRRQDLRVAIYPEAKQSGKPYKYAEQIGVPFVCLLRDAEFAENKVTLKNMRTGEQEIISREGVLMRIKL